MGLPLFIPPIESDVPPKPTKGPTDLSHARSPIRRTERRRQLNETREQRLRMLAALQASDYSSPRPTRTPRPSSLHPLHPLSSSLQRSSSTRSISGPADTARASGRQSPRLENPRVSELNDAERRYLGRAAASELPRGFAIDDLDDAWSQLNHAMPSHFPNTQSASTQHSARLPPVPSRYTPFGYDTSDVSRRSIGRREDDRDNSESRYRRRRYARYSERDALTIHRHGPRVRYADGLGDRDRSLSPEGDAVWDILQATLTPDPQPPSIGSSFASTVVSANTSETNETNGANSASTSMTTPNEEIEPPCDPVTDNPGSDDEDESEEQPGLPDELWRRVMGPNWRRTYANVAAEAQSRQSPESGDASDPDREWLSGMHRIVAGLASRGDIPDEWWAQAGLSRSMSWEDSN